MAITNRMTVKEQVGRVENNRKRGLAVRVFDPITGYIVKAAKLFKSSVELRSLIPPANIEVRTPLGLIMNPSVILLTPDEIDAKAAEMDALFEVATPRHPQIEIPEMVALSGGRKIMKGEVSVGLFNQVMEGYKITGHNADALKALLDDPAKAGEALVYVNLHDAREFAKRLSDQTGRKFRIQTEAEWKEGRALLSGVNWTWTTDETEKNSGRFVLRFLSHDDRDLSNPENRFLNDAVRLVEDLTDR
ncbi:MAG: hypothetical protein WC863_04885 [Patescibacteria group bacterium]